MTDLLKELQLFRQVGRLDATSSHPRVVWILCTPHKHISILAYLHVHADSLVCRGVTTCRAGIHPSTPFYVDILPYLLLDFHIAHH